MKNLKKISRSDLKQIVGGEWGDPGGLGDFGPEPCGGSWSASMGPRCQCIAMGGTWACDKCITDSRDRIILAITNTCEQFNNWP
ncbi:hypothetical protein MKS83_17285 [Chryseobacterium sp. Y16C]|uniref:bacteriocin-like protein n=1 Tax=Chryseobacterium sp. Y16C TaxID=2920939 RepID=UPI001F0B2A59|nr:hypothetical protein [Chryseobacterium sp. Y16C]UMQ41144.1 hypothetical protein MKS83_17285 [Chryseobacterium sp. Y16C]